MTDAAIIAGCLVDVRNVGTHKSVKLTIHVPEEHATRVVAAFGWPTGVNPVSVAIARLSSAVPVSAEATPRPAPALQPPTPVGEVKSRRPFDEIPAPQQAGILCNEKAFQKFLCEEYERYWIGVSDDGRYLSDKSPVERWRAIASVVVRMLCDVDSRSELTHDNAKWSSLVLAYRLWQRHPELSDAS